MVTAYTFVQNLFPIFSNLKVKTNKNCQKSVDISIGFSALTYTFLSICSVFLFGEQITEVKANLLLNVNREYKIDSTHWESFLLRFLFLIVLAASVPFIFSTGKDGVLIIINEI